MYVRMYVKAGEICLDLVPQSVLEVGLIRKSADARRGVGDGGWEAGALTFVLPPHVVDSQFELPMGLVIVGVANGSYLDFDAAPC